MLKFFCAACIRSGTCVPTEALVVPVAAMLVQPAFDCVLHRGPVNPFVQIHPQL
jgi:hypothetical protein